MPAADVLVMVLAGGSGGRLESLTEHRAKPAVPFAGMYRLIDFPARCDAACFRARRMSPGL